MKFEKQVRHVVHDPREDVFRVSWDPVCPKGSVRKLKDQKKHLVGVAAAIGFWESVCRFDRGIACAKTVKLAWDAGDRYLLDSDAARQAAELVADLIGQSSEVEAGDLNAALIDLMNAIAEVRLRTFRMEDFDVLPILRQAAEFCLSDSRYRSWDGNVNAQKRCFLYQLRQSERTAITYTLISLYFGEGPTPILTTKQRKTLLALPKDDAVTYFDDCLRRITEWRFS